MTHDYDRYRSVQVHSSEEARFACAADAVRALKGLQAEVTYATVGMRMARFLPESAETLHRYIRSLPSTKKLELGLITEKQAQDHAASVLRGKLQLSKLKAK